MAAYVVDVVLILMLAACVATDITRGRIPNAITYPTIAVGLAAAALGFPPGFRAAVEGMVAGAASLWIASALGAIGGGNVKLMAAVGALKGLSFVLTALFYSVLVGGVWAALVLVWSGQTRVVLSDVGKVFARGAPSARIPPRGGALPFSVAIGVGTVIALTLKWRLEH